MSEFSIFSYTEDNLPILPPRPERSHKGTFGRVLCVCGSPEIFGAAYLAAFSSYRVGAGLVRVLTPEENRTPLATLLPEALITTYDAEHPDPHVIADAAAWADVLVIGCGLGTAPEARGILSDLLRSCDKPRVLDADALNLLSRNPSLMKYTCGAILTPHALEMSRLTGKSVEEILQDPATTAYEFAKQHEAICVLKDHETVVSDGGALLYRNNTGNSGMATGGSGDVLAGILGGLLAQSKDTPAFVTATLGVYLHGLSGDLKAKELGEHALMARDLIDGLPLALKAVDRS